MREKGYYSGFLQGNGERLLAAGGSAKRAFPVQMDKVRKKHFACKTEALEQKLNQLKQKASREGIAEDENLNLQLKMFEQELGRIKARASKI